MQHFEIVLDVVMKKEYFELKEDLQIQMTEIPKGGMLPQSNGSNKTVFVLRSGDAHGARYSSDGREVDFVLYRAGDLIGDISFFYEKEKNEYAFFADSRCTVVSFSYEKLLKSSHVVARMILSALLEAFALQYVSLKKRTKYLTAANLREKIFMYLSDLTTNFDWFEVPLDRNSLASYLYCDRSSLCRELSRMKQDGIIDFHKNRFRILLSGIPKND